MVHGSRWGVAIFALGVGAAVTAGAGSAAADDGAAESGKQDARRGSARAAESNGPARQSLSIRTTPRPAAAAAPAANTAPVAKAGSKPQDPFAATLAAIGREIARLFFNHTPTANPMVHAQTADRVVTGMIGGSDPEDDVLAYALVTGPAHGTVTVDAAGEFTYIADERLAATGGTDTFAVSVRDTGFHLNFWTPTTITVPVTVAVRATPPPESGSPPGTVYRVVTGGPDITGFVPGRDRLDLGDASAATLVVVDTAAGLGFRSPQTGKTTVVRGIPLGELTADNFTPIADDGLRRDITAALAWESGISPQAHTVYARSYEAGRVERVAFDPATDVVDFRYYGAVAQLTIADSEAGVVIGNTATGQQLILKGITKAQWAQTVPGLSIADATVTEGDGPNTHLKFVATLDRAPATEVTVRYNSVDGTATAGADYVAVAGTLTFAPGITTQAVYVDILGDTTDEPDETLRLVLSNASGARIATLSALGTIVDDDPAALTPGLSVSDASVSESSSGTIAAGLLHTSGNQIVDSAGNPVQIAGVNWFGLESSTGAPHGLWTRGYKDMIDQMAAEGFNTIRLPFASETLHTGAAPNGIDFSKNPDLQGLSSLQVMDAIISYAGSKGMRVILDHHRSEFGSGTSGNGLWYGGQYTEDAWVADWAMLAGRYKDNPTVIGFDLHNEPYNGTWGGGGATDWARAAERAGNAALAVNPGLLVFVEGVAGYQGQNYWWGGNLMGAADRPIVLNVPGRVVYSPHDYPNSVYPQPWFAATDFGAALPAKFRQMWGYLYETNTAPVYLGEFGTNLRDPKDVVWFEAITSYLSGDFDNNGTVDIPAGTPDLSWTFWSWNPNSGDTGGILTDDWTTVNENKMAYLTPILTPIGFAGGSAVATFTVSLSAPSTGPVTVGYATADGTATAGADYTATAGTLTFAPGETRKTIAITVASDGIAEGTEDFHVMLSNPSGATIVDAMGMGTITDPGTSAPPVSPVPPPAPGNYVDIMTFGMFHGSSHTGADALAGGRTAITTEALVAYNNLRGFSHLAPIALEDVGRWAFANDLTNNAQAWDNDLSGVGLYYAMQGAKVGWIAADKYTPQLVADIERTARLGSTEAVMAMAAQYGQPGFAAYLTDHGYVTAFVDTLRMEPHYGGWMHDRANGKLVIEAGATAHDVNHLTVLSHDQLRPFMNDTWDWPQWPALNVSDQRVIGYFTSMVTLTDPRGGPGGRTPL